MAENQRIPLPEAVYKHGLRRTCRDAQVTTATLTYAVKGQKVPRRETAEKIAAALGLSLDQIEWPRGYGETVRVVEAPQPHSEPAGLYQDRGLRSEIESLIEREVERRLAVAQQSSIEQTAAQSNEETR